MKKDASTPGNDPGWKNRFMHGVNRSMDARTLTPVHSSPIISGFDFPHHEIIRRWLGTTSTASFPTAWRRHPCLRVLAGSLPPVVTPGPDARRIRCQEWLEPHARRIRLTNTTSRPAKPPFL